MNDSQIEFFRECTVRIQSGNSRGTGFFIAPGLVITCAHVLPTQVLPAPVISIFWKMQQLQAEIFIEYAEIDLVLLQVREIPLNIPCVHASLEADITNTDDSFFTIGYSENYTNGDSATFDYEGITFLEGNEKLLKLKSGQAVPGFSGAPVLNCRTHRVQAILSISRDKNQDLGGRAISIQSLFSRHDGLREQHNLFHQQNVRWEQAFTMSKAQMLPTIPYLSCEQGAISNYVRIHTTRLPNETPSGTESVSSLARNSYNFDEIFRSQDFKQRLEYSAWLWLAPNFNLNHLEQIRVDSGVRGLELRLFYVRLDQACEKIAREHPVLSLWIRRRRSLLEYASSSSEILPSEKSTQSLKLNLTLLDIVSRPPSKRDRRLAGGIIKNALILASQVVCRVLVDIPEGETYGFFANLMIPIKKEDLRSNIFASQIAQDNIKLASYLWEGHTDADTYLVVVTETNTTEQHLGFWLPVVEEANISTPGALEAYRNVKGSSILLDDLPPFGTDLPSASRSRWEKYLSERLKLAAFVSLPLFLESQPGERKMLAILNVNIISAERNKCSRAYHDQWLRIAQRQAAPLIGEAYKAFTIQHAKLGRASLPQLYQGLQHFPLLELTGSRPATTTDP